MNDFFECMMMSFSSTAIVNMLEVKFKAVLRRL